MTTPNEIQRNQTGSFERIKINTRRMPVNTYILHSRKPTNTTNVYNQIILLGYQFNVQIIHAVIVPVRPLSGNCTGGVAVGVLDNTNAQ